eukprot:5185749-Alexandrium_andersonii.AAC.1
MARCGTSTNLRLGRAGQPARPSTLQPSARPSYVESRPSMPARGERYPVGRRSSSTKVGRCILRARPPVQAANESSSH